MRIILALISSIPLPLKTFFIQLAHLIKLCNCNKIDNGTNFFAGFNTSGWTQISCFGHCLDLDIQKCLSRSQVDRAIDCCNNLLASFHQSWKKQRDLEEKQLQLGLKDHKLISAVKTRRRSTYSMIERFLE